LCLREKLNPGLFPTGDYRRDGMALFGKLIRTKNVDSLQEEDADIKPGKNKLKVRIYL
jgi:hypothetical protein